jgi:nucleotide-binding universal stress UspA family protein
MSQDRNPGQVAEAVADFGRARWRARIEQVLARLSGRSAALLEYEEVRKRLRVTRQVSRGLRNIPLDAIVGSVVILDAAREHRSALIAMGGCGFSPVVQIVLGSAVDQVLGASQRPVLICR